MTAVDPTVDRRWTGADADPAKPTPAPCRRRHRPRRRHRCRRRRRAGASARAAASVVGVVLVGAFVFLLAKGLGSSLDYFETVDQAVAHKATLGTQTFRLEGLVVPGTVHRIAGGVRLRRGGHGRAPSRRGQHGNPPQLFQPDIPVVVVGHFAGATFVSDQIIVDHTAQYVAKPIPTESGRPTGPTR